MEEIKSKVDIVQLVGEYVPLKRAGRNFKGLCPFHGEKTPSFMVNPELQIFKCFGCGLGGDVYSFLQRIEGLEFGEALQTLADRVGVKLVSYRPSQSEELKEKLISINTLAAEVYHFILTSHRLGQPALAYVKSRGLTDETISDFKLGYAPAKWDVLTKFLTAKKKIPLAQAESAGLTIADKKYDRFRDRLMFPITNHRGQIVGFTGRLLPWSKDTSGKYVNSPDSEVFHKSDLLYGLDHSRSAIKSTGTAVIVEGQMDFLPSFQAGVKNVVASGGTALTARQIELLRRLGDTVILALDADIAGDAAVRRGIEVAEKAGLIIKVVPPGEKYKDPGEWATADPQGWAAAIASAMPIYDFYLQSAVTRHGTDVVAKKRIARELLPIWATIDDDIVRAHYIRQLADVLGVGEEDVRNQLVKISNPKSQVPNNSQILNPKSQVSRREVLEAYLVELALKGEKVDQLLSPPVVKWIATPFWHRVVSHWDKGAKSAKKLIGRLPAELRGKVEELILKEDGYSDREWEKTVHRLEEVAVREEIAQYKSQAQPDAKLVRLTSRLAQLTKQD